MVTIYLLSVIENGMGALVIILGISAFIALLDQNTIHNKLLLHIEDNQKAEETVFKNMNKSSSDFIETTSSESNPTIQIVKSNGEKTLTKLCIRDLIIIYVVQRKGVNQS